MSPHTQHASRLHGLLAITCFLGLAAAADAQIVLSEGFNGGVFPPAGWTVVDNLGNGSWNKNSSFGVDNTTGGAGDCAAMNSFHYGQLDVDGELITPAFDIPGPGCLLEFKHFFWHWPGGNVEFGEVDIHVGGGTWSTLAQFSGADFQGLESIDLGAYAGATDVQLRFHYYDAHEEWWWQVDDVGLFLREPGIKYCSGDGLGTSCPCANHNDGSMGGCHWGNPAFPGGGALTATGSTSMGANNTLLLATGVADNFGIFFGANNAVNGGSGNILNDGLRCAGGGLVRLIPPTMATGNQLSLPAPLQLLDTGASSGVTRRYQYWFRTPLGPCGQQANLTNGYEIAWGS